jgi:4-hydroxy-tetrahydrodipicolinate synthase
MNKQKLQGVWTALITPFKKDGSIDWESFDKLIEMQIIAGVTGLVISGTTGESPTLTDEECVLLTKRAKEKCTGKCIVMVGTGTNNTEKSIYKTKIASEAGADMIILVNPYYNKPTQQGLYLHFKSIAESTDLPIILYNIKGRTGVNLETPTLIRLANEVKNIVGVKEASGDLSQIKDVCEKRPSDFVVLSGDDNLTFQMMQGYGVDGVISVTSNILPKEMIEMVSLSLDKNFSGAEKINEKLTPLFKTLFIETNPIPVKYAAFEMGLCENIYRLPMCEIGEEHGKQVKELLKEMKIIS